MCPSNGPLFQFDVNCEENLFQATKSCNFCSLFLRVLGSRLKSFLLQNTHSYRVRPPHLPFYINNDIDLPVTE